MPEEEEAPSSGLKPVVVAALIAFLLGHFAAAAVLLSEPVSVISRASDAERIPAGEVYLLRGDRSRTLSYRAKEAAWEANQLPSMTVGESELNSWSDDRLKVPQPDADEEPGMLAKWFAAEATPAQFRIDGDRLFIAALIKFAAFPGDHEYIYQVEGIFEATTYGVRFRPERATLGQAPITVVPGLRNWVFDWVINRYSGTEGYQWLDEHWESIQQLTIQEGQLQIARSRAN